MSNEKLKLRNLCFATLSGKRVQVAVGLDTDPFQRTTPEGRAVHGEGAKGLVWQVYDPARPQSQEEVLKWFDSHIYACPTPKWDGVALIGKSKEFGNPDGHGLVLNADGSLRWIVQPPRIVYQPTNLSTPVVGQYGGGLRECVLREPSEPYVYWNVTFPGRAFNWYEMRQYDPDTNRFTDKVLGASRD